MPLKRKPLCRILLKELFTSEDPVEPKSEGVRLHYDIKVPGHGIVEEVEPLAAEVTLLRQEADKISILNPFSGLLQYLRAAQKKREIAPRVGKALGETLGALRSPVDGAPGAMAGFLQSHSMGQSLTATMVIQLQWQWYTGTLDRKAAFLVAALSIYISVIALVATVVLGLMSLDL